MNLYYLQRENWFLAQFSVNIKDKVSLLLKKWILEQNRKKIVFLIPENISKAANLAICVHTFNIFFPLGAN